MPQVPFVGETYTHRSLNVSAQRTLNLYPELINNSEAKSDYILVGTPGTTEFSDISSVTDKVCRGLHFTSTSVLYTVNGEYLIEIGTDGSVINSYLMSGTNNPVSMADNGKYLLIADGENIWYLNLEDGTFQTINDLPTALDRPVKVKYIGQRIVATSTDSNQFWWSEVGPDGALTWLDSSVASAEGSADNINSIAVSDGELVLFGPRSYEVYRVVGDARNPFSRVNGSFTNIGCGAPNSVAEIMGKVFWLGSSTAGKNQVFMLEGYQAIPVSNHAIATALSESDNIVEGGLSTTSDGIGFTYQQNNHIFYVLNLLQANKTLVYDLLTRQWHERSSRDPVTNLENRWQPLYAQYAYDRVVVGNGDVANIMELDLNKYTEYDGRQIKRQRRSPIYWNDYAQITYHDFIVDMETGVGLTPIVQGNDPQAMLRFSDDSGHTWSSEKWRSMGKVGKYMARCRWNKLGKSRARVFEVTITDPVKVVMIGASARVTKGSNR